MVVFNWAKWDSSINLRRKRRRFQKLAVDVAALESRILMTVPVITSPGNQTTREGTAVSLPVTASNPGNTSLSVTVTGLPMGLFYNSSTAQITGSPMVGDSQVSSGGVYSVILNSSNISGSAAPVTFTWTVTPAGTIPVITSPGNQTTREGAAVSLPVTVSNPGNTSLSVTVTGLPIGLSYNSSTAQITGSPMVGDSQGPNGGVYSVTLTASNLYGSGVPVTFTWTVTPAGTAPVITNPGNQTTREGTAVSLPLTVSNPGNTSLTVTATGLPLGLTYNSSSGQITGTPVMGDGLGGNYGVYTVSITAVNMYGTMLLTFTWTILGAVNCGQDGDYNSFGGDVVRVAISTLLSNDTDTVPRATIDPTTFVIANAGQMTIRRVGTDLLIIPPMPNIGDPPKRYTFTYSVSDTAGNTGTGTVGIFVFGNTLQQCWIATINREEAKSIGYIFYDELGLAAVYAQYRAAAAAVTFGFGNLGTGATAANASYSPYNNTVTVNNGTTTLDPTTVIHETTHIIDDNNNWYLSDTGVTYNLSKAESLGWASQNFLLGSSAPLMQLRLFEDRTFGAVPPAPGQINVRSIYSAWSTLPNCTYTVLGADYPIGNAGWQDFRTKLGFNGISSVFAVYVQKLAAMGIVITLPASYTDNSQIPPVTYTIPASLW